MYSKGIFGQFYPTKSIMHSINPTVKIVCLFLTALLLLFTNQLDLHLMFLGMMLLIISMTKVPFKYYFNIFYSLRYVYLLVLVVCFLLNVNVITLFAYLLKIIICVLYLAYISYTTSISELSFGIEKCLEPFNLLNIKLGGISYFITSIIKFYPNLIRNIDETLLASASRGIDYNHSFFVYRYYALFKTFPYSLKKTFNEFKKNKLECKFRLHNFKKKRTNINHNKVGFYDIMLLIFHVLFVLAYVFDAGLIK